MQAQLRSLPTWLGSSAQPTGGFGEDDWQALASVSELRLDVFHACMQTWLPSICLWNGHLGNEAESPKLVHNPVLHGC